MSASRELVSAFRVHLPQGAMDVDDQALGDAVAAARAAWPALTLADEAFGRHLAERLPEGRALGDLNVPDLYLACACLARAAGAVEAFERTYLARVPAYVARTSSEPAFVEEVVQVLRERLFVGERPKLAEYSGRGALAAWVRVVASRTAVSLWRGTPDVAAEDDDARAVPATPDPELGYIKTRYKEPFEASLREAFGALDARGRTLLRLHFVDGLSVEQIGVTYGVHKATAARWIVSARETLFDGARRGLEQRLNLRREEFESFAAMMRSQLEISLPGLLRER